MGIYTHMFMVCDYVPSSHIPVMLDASLWAGLFLSSRGGPSEQLALRVMSIYCGAHSFPQRSTKDGASALFSSPEVTSLFGVLATKS